MNELNARPTLIVYSNGEILGDALLKLPALATLRQFYPDHHITWLAGSGFSFYARALSPLVKGLVDEVREDIRLGQDYRELLRPPVMTAATDILIDTQSKLKTTLILKRLPHRLFISATANFIFSDRKPATEFKQGSVQRRLIDLFSLASANHAQANFRLQLPDEYRQLAEQALPKGNDYIGLAPGSGVQRKCWPLDSFIQLAQRQALAGRTPVFFLGPNEAGWQQQLARAVPSALFPEQEKEDASINPIIYCLALAQRIRVGVANDSGTGHVFAIAGQPLVSLFGPSNAEKFVHDNAEARIIIQAEKFGGRAMSNIPVEAVDEAVNLLAQRDAK